MDLESRVALITGQDAVSGGPSPLHLAEDGAPSTTSTRTALRRWPRRCGGRAAEAVAVTGDVIDRDAAFEMVEQATNGLGVLDIVVNNASIART